MQTHMTHTDTHIQTDRLTDRHTNMYIYIYMYTFNYITSKLLRIFFFFALSLYAKELKAGIKVILITVEVKVWNCEYVEECG